MVVIIRQYAVLTLNQLTGVAGLMGTTDTLEQATEMLERAKRAAWPGLTIYKQFKSDAPESK